MPDEKIFSKLPARVYENDKLVGARGWMIVTNKRVLFRARVVNIWKKEIDIQIPEISEIEKFNVLGIMPNSLIIKTKSGNKYHFVVWGRNRLIKYIKSQINVAPAA